VGRASLPVEMRASRHHQFLMFLIEVALRELEIRMLASEGARIIDRQGRLSLEFLHLRSFVIPTPFGFAQGRLRRIFCCPPFCHPERSRGVNAKRLV
jgi:hypothetical protein